MNDLKAVIGLRVSSSIKERFIIYSKMCNDENILEKFERKKNDELFFRLSFSNMQNLIYYFFALGQIADMDLGKNLYFDEWQKN